MMTGSSYRLNRTVRTPHSEAYEILRGDAKLGEAHFHFAGDVVHAIVICRDEISPEEEQELVSQLDFEVVSGYLPEDIREDFLVTVFRGTEVSSYSDVTEFEEDFEEEDLFDEESGEFN